MHYRYFTASDTLLIVGIALLTAALVYWWRPGAVRPLLSVRAMVFLLVGAVVCTLISTLYSELLQSGSYTYLARGFPRYLFLRRIASIDGDIAPVTFWHARYVLENVMVYASILLAGASLWRALLQPATPVGREGNAST